MTTDEGELRRAVFAIQRRFVNQTERLRKVIAEIQRRFDRQREVNQSLVKILKGLISIDRKLAERGDSGKSKFDQIAEELKQLGDSVESNRSSFGRVVEDVKHFGNSIESGWDEVKERRDARAMLSRAELRVYDLMFTYANKEIGDRLNLSEDTIKNHVKAIRRKTGITRGRKDKFKAEIL